MIGSYSGVVTQTWDASTWKKETQGSEAPGLLELCEIQEQEQEQKGSSGQPLCLFSSQNREKSFLSCQTSLTWKMHYMFVLN